MGRKGIVAVVAAVVVVGIVFLTTYNGLINRDVAVEEAWAAVETQYQRRADLIPNLVATVRGAADFEAGTLKDITDARSAWTGAATREEKAEAATRMDGALSRLLLVAENYPQIQGTQAFRDLSVQLEGTENRVSFARDRYNKAVAELNAAVRRFPGNLVAGFAGVAPERAMFRASEGAATVPAVSFDRK